MNVTVVEKNHLAGLVVVVVYTTYHYTELVVLSSMNGNVVVDVGLGIVHLRDVLK